MNPHPEDALVLGIDVGTSAVRCVAVDAQDSIVAQARQPLPPPLVTGSRVTQDPRLWWDATETAVMQTVAAVSAERIAAIAVDGTSGTVLLTDAQGTPQTEGWLYNDASCVAEATRIAAVAPRDSPARGASSPLARLLHLQAEVPQARHLLHQADWISGRLCGRFGVSDENNVLKLGYDLHATDWPTWMDALGVRRDWLPRVMMPGTPIGEIQAALAARWGLNASVAIAAGTTDGVASFLATGASEPGDAVTALGSTLVVKLLSPKPVVAPGFGLYSHRLGTLWLPGGASNSGGAALQRHFDIAQIEALTPLLDPERDTGLDYYPLPSVGERFPVADPKLASRVTPRPADDARFLQGLLEGMARIERQAYDRIAELGAGGPTRVFSIGGGARNAAWTRIRERQLGVPMAAPRHHEAACGAAVLARRALR
jgi:D-ribulokinase